MRLVGRYNPACPGPVCPKSASSKRACHKRHIFTCDRSDQIDRHAAVQLLYSVKEQQRTAPATMARASLAVRTQEQYTKATSSATSHRSYIHGPTPMMSAQKIALFYSRLTPRSDPRYNRCTTVFSCQRYLSSSPNYYLRTFTHPHRRLPPWRGPAAHSPSLHKTYYGET